MTTRIDPIREKYYKPLEIAEKISGFLFYILASLSFATLVIERNESPLLHQTIALSFVVLVVTYFVINLISRYYLFPRAEDARRAILLIMREAGSPIVDNIRDSNVLIKAVTEQTGTALPIHLLVQDLILNPDLYATPATRDVLIDNLYERLKSYLPTGTSIQSFKNLSAFDQTFFLLNQAQLPNLCAVSHLDRKINYTIGTVASMKGETHIASLVMESYGGNSRKFDLEMALPYVAGIEKNPANLSKLQRGQIRNLYVAMSRPTHFLCLAVNETRIVTQTLNALKVKGWLVEQ